MYACECACMHTSMHSLTRESILTSNHVPTARTQQKTFHTRSFQSQNQRLGFLRLHICCEIPAQAGIVHMLDTRSYAISRSALTYIHTYIHTILMCAGSDPLLDKKGRKMNDYVQIYCKTAYRKNSMYVHRNASMEEVAAMAGGQSCLTYICLFFVCVYIYIYIYIHTHTHTYTQTLMWI
jgi:hypothetical protein